MSQCSPVSWGPQPLLQLLPILPLVALPLPLQLHLTQLLSLPALCKSPSPVLVPSPPHPPPCPVPGVIFQTRKDGSLPPHVHYKIRQNSSFTEKTNEIRRAYWRPGPNTGGRFYFLYGFVWIQGEARPWGRRGWGHRTC